MWRSRTLFASLACLVSLFVVGNLASASARTARFRSCRPDVGFDIRVSGAGCTVARQVVAESFIKSTPIRGKHGRIIGFIVEGWRCRVTQGGSENRPIPARYRCQHGHAVLTWAYHP
jgi:hypothetical protein